MHNISQKDKVILLDLAKKINEYSKRSIEEEKRKKWYAKNSLVKCDPIIFADPDNSSVEHIKKSDLICEGEEARAIEWGFRYRIFRAEYIKDDVVIDNGFGVGHTNTFDWWGIESKRVYTEDTDRTAFKSEPALKTYADMSKMHFPKVTVDYEDTKRNIEFYKELFNGILEVELSNWWWWSLGITLHLSELRGLEEMMFDMYDEPENLHKALAYIRDGYFDLINYLEKNDLLTLNNRNHYIGSGAWGWTKELPRKDFNGHVTTKDMWGLIESQETVCVSPNLFEEYIFPYQKQVAEKFGLVCYGCCEAIDKRFHIINKIPNLRRVSVSPWSDVEIMAEYLGDKYVYSWKPNPAYLAGEAFDEDFIRGYIRKTLEVTKNNHLEIILKDCNTVRGDITRIPHFVQIAREEISKLY